MSEKRDIPPLKLRFGLLACLMIETGRSIGYGESEILSMFSMFLMQSRDYELDEKGYEFLELFDEKIRNRK